MKNLNWVYFIFLTLAGIANAVGVIMFLCAIFGGIISGCVENDLFCCQPVPDRKAQADCA